jgi:hypothetical protein
MRIGMHLGPFWISTSTRRRRRRRPTQAQKRAAAKAQEQRARQREFNRKHTGTVQYLRTVQGTDCQIGVFGRENPLDPELHLYLRKVLVTVPAGTWVTVTYRSGTLLAIDPAEVPASVVARAAAKAEYDRRAAAQIDAELQRLKVEAASVPQVYTANLRYPDGTQRACCPGGHPTREGAAQHAKQIAASQEYTT